MLVDDHEVVRLGLRSALELEEDFEVVMEASSGEEALRLLENQSADLILIDVMMEGMGGIACCRQIKESIQPPKVLMLTSSSDEEAMISSFVAGADGYLLKHVSRFKLLEALRTTAKGETVLDPSFTAHACQHLHRVASGVQLAPQGLPRTEDPLSERELEVVKLIALGQTNKEIAQSLIIAEKTARNHVSRILAKLGLTRRSQAAAWAMHPLRSHATNEGP